MLSSKLWPLAGLLLIAVALAAGNLWFTAARSTIPLALNSKIVELEIRNEKHPGFDDVFFIHLDDGRRLHVDRPVFQSVKVGDLVQKPSFEHVLNIARNGEPLPPVELTPSADHSGMHTVMPLALGVAIALAGVACWTRSETRTGRTNHGDTEGTEKITGFKTPCPPW